MGEPIHSNTHPHAGFIGQAATQVATHCLLPDPRPQGPWDKFTRWMSSLTRPLNHLSQKECAARQIAGTATLYHVPPPKLGSFDYEHILWHARSFAHHGIEHCQVRDFDDMKDEPHLYKGYRAPDGACKHREARIIP